MARRVERDAASRVPLSRERVLDAAVAIADAGGIEALTMRRLAEELGAEAMSLYYHVANKEDILDGVVDALTAQINDIVERIDAPTVGDAWRSAVRSRILAAREVFLQHPWAPAVFETRVRISPAVIRYYDSLIGIMRDGGFSYDLAHHSLHALGSRALGFTQELFKPAPTRNAADDTDLSAAAMAEQFPHLAAMIAAAVHDQPDTTLGWCDDQTEFEFGLDVVLDGLDRLRKG